MKRLIFFFTLAVLLVLDTSAQVILKVRYPAVELINKDVLKDMKDVKTFFITTQQEFDTYFKLTDASTIDFSTQIVLVAMVGGKEADNFISINAARYLPDGRYFWIRYDIEEKAKGTCGKYCVATVQKMEYRKIKFLKGSKYTNRDSIMDGN